MSDAENKPKPKPTAEDIRGPVMRLDASRQTRLDASAALQAKAAREAIHNTRRPDSRPPGKPAE